jgi:hypothetical protein
MKNIKKLDQITKNLLNNDDNLIARNIVIIVYPVVGYFV